MNPEPTPTKGLRRKDPAPGPLATELRTILNSAGIPTATTEDRFSATGVLLTQDGEEVLVEWFVSIAAREAAAIEQREGNPNGRVTSFHSLVRYHMMNNISGLLANIGYKVEQAAADLEIRVSPERNSHPVGLAADINRAKGAPRTTLKGSGKP